MDSIVILDFLVSSSGAPDPHQLSAHETARPEGGYQLCTSLVSPWIPGRKLWSGRDPKK